MRTINQTFHLNRELNLLILKKIELKKMITVLSPAKTLDFETQINHSATKPRLVDNSEKLIEVLRTKDESEVQELMSISEKLASLNVERYHAFSPKHSSKNSKQSLFAFQGDVYQGLEAESFSDKEVLFAQEHIRMLSGLYGLLRPLDLIQPYRLEMGTNLRVNGHKNLYEFWGDHIVNLLKKDLKKQGDKTILNLASKEYFRAIDRNSLQADIIDISFKDYKNGQYKIISFFAKKARGMMARYLVKNQITNIEDLRGFDYDGYRYDEATSTDTTLSFLRG